MKQAGKYSILKTTALTLILQASVQVSWSSRPFYLIKHQVNSLEEVQESLDQGANGLESDVRFHSNGSVKEIHHGSPCECNVDCEPKAELSDYLKHVRDLTDPSRQDSYYGKMLLQYLDLKLKDSHHMRESGRDLARHVLEHLWGKDGSRDQEVRILLSFPHFYQGNVVKGFVGEFRRQRKEHRLIDVGFDGGNGFLPLIRETYTRLNLTKNRWLGDGTINCHNQVHSYRRLKEVIAIRDSRHRFMEKAFAWTIDDEDRMREFLELGVDAMLTNLPQKLFAVLRDFQDDFRLADIEDDPFAYYCDPKLTFHRKGWT